MSPGKRRYTLIPAQALGLIADVLTQGAAKHGDAGWKDVVPVLYADALFRHLIEYRAGVWIDPDSGYPHLAHVAANALLLLAAEIDYRRNHPNG